MADACAFNAQEVHADTPFAGTGPTPLTRAATGGPDMLGPQRKSYGDGLRSVPSQSGIADSQAEGSELGTDQVRWMLDGTAVIAGEGGGGGCMGARSQAKH